MALFPLSVMILNNFGCAEMNVSAFVQNHDGFKSFTLSIRRRNKLVHSVRRHSFKSWDWRGFWYAWLIGVQQNVPLVHLIQLERSKILEYLKETKTKRNHEHLAPCLNTFPAKVGVM